MADRIVQEGIKIGRPESYQWHIEGVKPSKNKFDIHNNTDPSLLSSVFDTNDFHNNMELVTKHKGVAAKNIKKGDGVSQAADHLSRNDSSFVAFFDQGFFLDGYPCKHVVFSQTICRKIPC